MTDPVTEAVGGRLSAVEIAITFIYLLALVCIGLFVAMRHKKKARGEAKEYFLAGKTLRWPVIGMALFATNISCVHLVSLAQAGFDNGLLFGNFEWMAAFTLVLLGLFFAPFYIKSGVSTLPDFMERRYNRQCRDWLAILSLVSAVVVHIGFSFLTGGIILESLTGINMYTTILVIALMVGIYTVVGGLIAVVVTEAIETVILILGAVVITYFTWTKMGGWEPMVQQLESLGESTRLSMLRSHGDASGLPWYAIFLGYPVLGIWYWCADQTIVQRVLGAKDDDHARVGPLFAGLIKILPVFIFVLPGLFAYTLYKSGGLDVSSLMEVGKDGEQVLNSKGIYGVMITQLLPPGFSGLVLAALLAALMSTVSGALNSISTLFSFDIYKRLKPDTPDHKLVGIGRITAGIALLVSIAMVPLLNNYESLFKGINDIIAHIAPPITCVFLVGVFWPKASATSAKLTLWIGSSLGALVFLLGKIGGPVAEAINALTGSSFMMAAFYLLVICVIMQVVFSFIWPAGESEKASGLYWRSPLEPLRHKGWPGIGSYKVLAILLFVIMAMLYTVFANEATLEFFGLLK
ncbi:MAG: sodium:solute symporter [Planctomycetota bacterium]